MRDISLISRDPGHLMKMRDCPAECGTVPPNAGRLTPQTEVSTTLKLSPRLSFIPIQLQVYILELLHSHFIKLQPRLDSKRNRRWRRLETKPVEIITKHCLLLFAPSIKQYSRNIIASKYQYHASAYSLQTICCRFIYLHEENANADDTDNSSRFPG